MISRQAQTALLAGLALLVGACASRPPTPRLAQSDTHYGYRATNWQAVRGDPEFGLVIAMSGGGTRAAALSYGVLEELRRTMMPGPDGTHRLLDEVKLITGVSGGSFTALAYALYGERLFDEYETRFLKRNVQGSLIRKVLNPVNWPVITGGTFTRTELAADYYDEILFGGATFGDLKGKRGPFVSVSATEIASGSRLTFNQNTFDLICGDLSGVRLARAAAASSAVPVIFAAVTLDNYGGSCGFDFEKRLATLMGPDVNRSLLDRAHRRGAELRALNDSVRHRYLHLVDGGVSDNLALRTLLEGLEVAMASRRFREVTGFDRLSRFAVIVVNSLSRPDTGWGRNEVPPGFIAQLIGATGISIDRYSYEQISLLHDYVRVLQYQASGHDSVAAIEFFPIEVSFDAIKDPQELRYFMELPASFSLSAEQVDRLREIGGRLLREAPEFQRLLRHLGAVP